MRRENDPELVGTSGFLGDGGSDESYDPLMRDEEANASCAAGRQADAGGIQLLGSGSPATPGYAPHSQPQRRQLSRGVLTAPRQTSNDHPRSGAGKAAVASHGAAPHGNVLLPLSDVMNGNSGDGCSALIPAVSETHHSSGLGRMAARATAKPSISVDGPAVGTCGKRGGGRHADARVRGDSQAGGGGWEPAVLCTVLAAIAGGALALAWLLTIAALRAAPAPACIIYQPSECLLQHKQPLQPPACSPVDCQFDVAAALACPLAASGSFVRQRKAGGPCADAFLDGSRQRIMPPCSKACCDGDLRGSFQPTADSSKGAQQWQPRSQRATGSVNSTRSRMEEQCSYFQYTGAEVLRNLQSNRVRILVLGDSLMRQLHGRLVHMFRGTRRVVDYRVGALARYAVCRAGDSFSLFDRSFDKRSMKPVPPKQLQPMVQHFSGRLPRAPGCDNSVGGRGDYPVAIDYIHSTRYVWQQDVLLVYRPELQQDEHLIVILAVGAAEARQEVPAQWLQYLEGISTDAKVVVVSTPTAGIADQDMAAALSRRNKLLQAWAASVDAISFADFDAMSKDAHRPPRAAGDAHWMCWLRWPRNGVRGKEDVSELKGANVLREPSTRVPVVGLHTTEDGACADEMNRNVWQVLFNIFMKHQWS